MPDSQMISEILINAIKYGKGDICITFTLQDGYACLEVRDEGPGFSPGFDSQNAAHTGLELVETLARHDLQGEIRYENAPSGGAKVTLTFPLPTQNRAA